MKKSIRRKDITSKETENLEEIKSQNSRTSSRGEGCQTKSFGFKIELN